jgi:tetratricopeptide (TPR) repeat protein
LRLSNFSKNLSEVFAELLELESKMGKMKLKKLEAKKFYANQLYIQAIECYTECLNFDPAHSFYNAIIYQNRAQCKYNLSLYPESFTDCSSSISENPHYLKPRLFELKLLVQLERFAHLLEKAVLLLKAFPDNKEVKKMHVYVVQQLQLRRERVEREVEKGFSEKTHYDVLEISRTASELEIKKAYRVKALMWHPDKHVEKSEEERLFAAAYFRHVQQAFDVLGNRDTRKAYDRELLFKNRRSTHNFGQTYYKGSAHYSDTGKKK